MTRTTTRFTSVLVQLPRYPEGYAAHDTTTTGTALASGQPCRDHAPGQNSCTCRILPCLRLHCMRVRTLMCGRMYGSDTSPEVNRTNPNPKHRGLSRPVFAAANHVRCLLAAFRRIQQCAWTQGPSGVCR